MSKVRVDPVVSTVRFYKNEIDPSIPIYNMSEPYYKVVVLSHLDSGTISVSNTVTSLTLSEMRELKKELKDSGYHTVQWRHNGKEQSFKL